MDVRGVWTHLVAVDGRLTLPSSSLAFAFSGPIDPGKPVGANSTHALHVARGRLYPSYGSVLDNLGPLDVRFYDAFAGAIVSEQGSLPEESFGYFSETRRMLLCVAGADARESQTFGNFYCREGEAWRKVRSVPFGVHVGGLVEATRRTYVHFQSGASLPLARPFVWLSENRGASWRTEVIDQDTIDSLSPLDLDVARREDGRETVYYTVLIRPVGGAFEQRVYFYDGRHWNRARFDDPSGSFRPFQTRSLGDAVLVYGGTFDASTNVFGTATYVLGQGKPREVPFLRDRTLDVDACAGDTRLLRCVDLPPASDPGRAALLLRGEELRRWSTVGPIELTPGARILSLAEMDRRLFLGTDTAQRSESGGIVQIGPASVYPIQDGILEVNADVPPNTDLRIQIKSALQSGVLNSRPYVGPDGTPDTWYTSAGGVLPVLHDGDTLIRMKLERTADAMGTLPFVRSVRIDSAGGDVTLAVDQGAGLHAAANDAAEGEISSPIFRFSPRIDGGRAYVIATLPAGTEVELQIRSGPSRSALSQREFVGPDGTSASSYGTLPAPLAAVHDRDTYLQYRAVLRSTDPARAPSLQTVVIEMGSAAPPDLEVESRAEDGGGSAGTPVSISIEVDGDYRRSFDLGGSARLLARDVAAGTSVPIEPAQVSLEGGRGHAKAILSRSGRTEICAESLGMLACAEPIEIESASAIGFRLKTDLTPPLPFWSGEGAAGSPFSLSVEAVDRFGNVADRYVGSITCRPWVLEPGDPVAAFEIGRSDAGRTEVQVVLPEPGEWNLVCTDDDDHRLAGSVTVLVR